MTRWAIFWHNRLLSSPLGLEKLPLLLPVKSAFSYACGSEALGMAVAKSCSPPSAISVTNQSREQGAFHPRGRCVSPSGLPCCSTLPASGRVGVYSLTLKPTLRFSGTQGTSNRTKRRGRDTWEQPQGWRLLFPWSFKMEENKKDASFAG